MIWRRRSAFRTTSICSRRGPARALLSITTYRFRARATRSSRAPTQRLRRFTSGCGLTSRARSISERRRHDASRSPLHLDAPGCSLGRPACGVGGGRPRQPAQSHLRAEPKPRRRSARRLVRGRPHLAASRGNIWRCTGRPRARHPGRRRARRRGGARPVHRRATRASDDRAQRRPRWRSRSFSWRC